MSFPEKQCNQDKADEEQLALDRLIFGRSMKYHCRICKQWHRLAPETVVMEEGNTTQERQEFLKNFTEVEIAKDAPFGAVKTYRQKTPYA